ncbi:MAG: Gfo/Idh/MocA family protein [Armatimonadota bacterium]
MPNVKCTAVCDIFPPNLKAGLDIAGQGARGFEDYREMLEKADIEAVMVTTPLHMHAPITLAALEAGKHVFVEKEMTKTIEEARQVVRAQRATGKIVQVGHQRRSNPTYRHALNLIEQGVLGKITHVRALWHRNGSWRRAVPKDVDVDVTRWGYPDLEHLINWRLYNATSNGLMAELGSHQLDVCDWFLKSRPLAVTGFAGLDHYKDGREVWDNVQCIYEYPDGVKVIYSSIQTNAYDDYYEQFMGTEGTLILTHENEGLLFRERSAEELAWEKYAHKKERDGRKGILLDAKKTVKKGKRERGPGQAVGGKEAQGGDAYYLEFVDWFHAIRTGQQPLANAEVGMASSVACILANEAMKKQKTIKFSPKHFKV